MHRKSFRNFCSNIMLNWCKCIAAFLQQSLCKSAAINMHHRLTITCGCNLERATVFLEVSARTHMSSGKDIRPIVPFVAKPSTAWKDNRGEQHTSYILEDFLLFIIFPTTFWSQSTRSAGGVDNIIQPRDERIICSRCGGECWATRQQQQQQQQQKQQTLDINTKFMSISVISMYFAYRLAPSMSAERI